MGLTKKECVMFLEKERAKAITAIHNNYEPRIKALQMAVMADAGYTEMIERMQNVFTEWYTAYHTLIDRLSQDKAVNYDRSRWGSIEQRLSECSGPDELSRRIYSGSKITTPEIVALQKEYDETRDKTSAEYHKVENALSALPTAKKCSEYLRSLGFDVAPLDEIQKQQSFPLAVPINSKYLFVKG